jgi:XTP/dITP diphosphohydrolase
MALSTDSTILLATGNAHKSVEMKAILKECLPQSIKLLTLKDIDIPTPPDSLEKYKTFKANAVAKARWYAQQSGCPCIADDSGLCVDALSGRPGVFSARWAGDNATDNDRRKFLLNELTKLNVLDLEKRTAKFVCVSAFATSENLIVQTRSGSVRGQILHAEAGSGGFGYDPLFFIPKMDATMAQISQDEKNKISHRGRSLRSLSTLICHDMQ